MNAPDPSRIQSLLDGAEQVATLPTIYTEINAAVEDPETTFSEIGNIISKDPSLCARLLKIVNSPFYGFSSEIETVSHAIAVIGSAQLRDLVLATTVMDRFRGIPKQLVDLHSFWLHSIGCGLTARILATYCRQANAERFYTLGILHDLGRLVMLISAPEEMKQAMKLSQEGPRPLVECERDVLGCDHGEVGFRLLDQWNLSSAFQLAIRYCHHPSRNPGLESTLLHVSDVVVHGLAIGSSGDAYVPQFDSRAWSRLDLTAAHISQVVDQLDRQLDEFVALVL